MTQPIIELKFENLDQTQSDVRAVWIKSINESLLASRGNVEQLQGWLEFARELKTVSATLLDEAKNGPAKADKQTLGVA